MGLLKLPPSKERLAFRAADALLREDPDLGAAGVKILSWDGDRESLLPPVPAMMPLVRIAPVSRPDEKQFEVSRVSVLGIRIETYVAGSDAGDLLDLWAAVANAFVQDRPFRDATVMCFLRSLGVDILRVEKPAYGRSTRDDAPYLGAEGEIVLKFLNRK